MEQRDYSLSVIVAGYNEQENIEDCMQQLYQMLQENYSDYELILVDDGSKDDTPHLMQTFAQEHAHVRFLPNYINLNFGASVARGLYAAQKDYAIYNAADLPLAAQDIPIILDEMHQQEADVMVLERTGYQTTRWRKITSNVNGLLLHIFFPRLIKGTPVLNFVQVFRTGILDQIRTFARSPIFIWAEAVFRAKRCSLRVINRPTACQVQKVRSGAFGHPHDILWGIYEMLRFRIRLWTKNL